ncbi:hypothetical protein P0F65_13530 [Sphingomonas sp. I4]
MPGATIDKTFVAAQVAAICAEHDVVELVFDPAQFADFESACEEIGFDAWKFEGPDKPVGSGLKMVRHAQGTRVMFEDRQYCMPRSIERLEDRILKDTIVIDSSPSPIAARPMPRSPRTARRTALSTRSGRAAASTVS